MSGPRPPAYTPTTDQLAAIARRAGLAPPAHVRPAPGGVVNPVLILDERAVLRINVRQAGDPKVAKEAWVLGLLAGAPPPLGARVPLVLTADTSRAILPYDYLLLDYLPGRVGGTVWPECDAAACAALSHQMGAIL